MRKNLGYTVTDQFGGPRPDPEIFVIFVEDERNFAPFKFEGTMPVGEVVRKLCAAKPAKHNIPTDYGLCTPQQISLFIVYMCCAPAHVHNQGGRATTSG